jgi:hypothetical protein
MFLGFDQSVTPVFADDSLAAATSFHGVCG